MRALLFLIAANIALCVVPAVAAPTACCTTTGTLSTSDALRALQRAVGTRSNCPLAHCDCNASGTVTVTDAMGILRSAVDSGTSSKCPPPNATTTTTTMPGSCGDGFVGVGEDCEPPHSFCRGGCNPYTRLCVDLICSDACTCPAARCGDQIIDSGESCDPPGSPCAGGGTCTARCSCRRP